MSDWRPWAACAAAIAGLFALHFVLPDYHHSVFARVMVLAVFALGYNILFGYGGLLSLGHAMFFAAGMYGAAMPMIHGDWPAWAGLAAGLVSGLLLGLAVGLLALRTIGVGFMIVTLMFSQAVFYLILFQGEITFGDEGWTIPQAARAIGTLDLSDDDTRYIAALVLLTVALFAKLALVRSRLGRVLVAVRENEERTRLLGFDPFRAKLAALVVSAGYASAAGAAYVVFWGGFGGTFAGIEYSILPLLWVLVGGAGTLLGPILGVVVMTYLADFAASDLMPWLADQWEAAFPGSEAEGLRSAHRILVGLVLVALVLTARAGILGRFRARGLTRAPVSETLLETTRLTRDFGGLRAVDQVGFRLRPGEIRGVIGPNGAGKTTFVSLLSGRLRPTRGRIRFEGRDITRLAPDRRVRLGIVYTFQITSIFRDLTVAENVALSALRTGAEPGAALARVGLADRAGEIAGNLSYGHQRLLEIAMGLALRPRLLILDEPTQGLSEGEIETFKALVREIAREATVILIEHNMDVVMDLAERITVLDQGAVLAEGSPEEIRADARVQAAYLGGPAVEEVA